MLSVRRVLFVCLVLLSSFAVAVGPAKALPQLLIDMRTNEVLHENDAGVPWHPASLTKLMTALLAFEAIETGQASLSTPVVTTSTALAVQPSRMGFPVGTAVTLEDALYLLIVKSANDIAIAIAETIAGSEAEFVGMMNRRAAMMGLTGTHFANAHGLHDPAQITTARDMAIIALTIRARFPQYDSIFGTRTVETRGARDHASNELLTGFEGTDGMKTGYICASGLNVVATVNRNGRQLMAVTLGANSSRERGEMTAQMMFSGFAGGYRGTGRSVVDIANRTDLAPIDMRPDICGANAEQYRAARQAAFPAGLEGQISYLTDTIVPPTHRTSVLGRLADVPLPRPRPDSLPQYAAGPGIAQGLASFGDAATVSLQPSSMVPPALAAPIPPPRPAGL